MPPNPTQATPRIEAQANSDRFYRPEIDGLRLFAFLAVYCQHTIGYGVSGVHHHVPVWVGNLLAAIGSAGIFGVDLFFVLSSYLITELLMRERAVAGKLDVRAFYIRRMLRIWPLYFFGIAIAVMATIAVASEHLQWYHVLGLLLFCGNWAIMLRPVITIGVPLWSVSVEEQFYIAWPWVVRRLSGRGMALCALGAIAVAACVAAALVMRFPERDLVTFNSFSRLDGIAIGVLLAVGLRGRVPRLSSLTRVALLCACVAVLLWIAFSFRLLVLPLRVLPVVVGWPLAAAACGGLVLAVLGSCGKLSAPLRSAPLVYLGRISYGLYVYHELALLIIQRWFPEHGASPAQMMARFFFGLALTVPMAAVSYRWLELPFLRLKRRQFTVVPSRPD